MTRPSVRSAVRASIETSTSFGTEEDVRSRSSPHSPSTDTSQIRARGLFSVAGAKNASPGATSKRST